MSVGDMLMEGAEPPRFSILASPKSRTLTLPSGVTLMFGFQIAMNDAFIVRHLNRIRDLSCDRQRVTKGERASSNDVRERFAVDKFEDNAGSRIILLEPIYGGNVRVIQRRKHFCFALKATYSIRVTGELIGQDLDGDFTLELQVPCAIDLTHAAFSEQRNDFVRAELVADGDGQSTTFPCLAVIFVDCIPSVNVRSM